MTVKIPKTFSLMNVDFEVRHATDPEQQAMDTADPQVLGLCDSHEGEILLGRHPKREMIESTFFHELAHALFESIGREDLSDNEGLVDAIGGAIHQYEKTKEGSVPLRRKKNAKDVQTSARRKRN